MSDDRSRQIGERVDRPLHVPDVHAAPAARVLGHGGESGTPPLEPRGDGCHLVVILIQDQLSKNRIIIDVNSKGQIEASVTSSTHERRSQTRVSSRKAALVLKMNVLTCASALTI